MYGVIFAVILLAIVGIILLAVLLPNRNAAPEHGSYEIKQFTNKSQLANIMASETNFMSYRSGNMLRTELTLTDSKNANETGAGGNNSTSKTNVQVEGLDEADVVKVDNQYIYSLQKNKLRIVRVDNGNMIKVFEKNFSSENFYADEILLVQNRLVILGNSYLNRLEPSIDTEKPASENDVYYMYDRYSSMIEIRVYNIEDREQPELVKSIRQSGSFKTARLKDNVLTYVSQYWCDFTDSDRILPKVSEDGEKPKEIDINKVFHITGLYNTSYATIGRINVETLLNHEYSSVVAGSSTIYFSGNNIYLCDVDYYHQFVDNGKYRNDRDTKVSERTRIVRVSNKTLKPEKVGEIEGAVSDRYWLDEYNGYLRVASTSGFNLYSSVFVLNGDLQTVGKITNIAPGERIYSARFVKENGSIVTFRNVDPLFKIDFSNPEDPKISDGLKKEGVSMYLHPIAGTKLQIGLGNDSDENGLLKGVEVVLFDMSGEDAVIINKDIIGKTRAYSEALYNPRAILYDQEKDVFGFHVTYSIASDYSFDKSAFFIYGFKDEQLVKRGEFKLKTGNDYYIYNANIRGVIIGDYVYIVDSETITSHDLNAEDITAVIKDLELTADPE